MTIGIYAITAPSGKAYVGQSINVERRLGFHKSRLRSGKHHNAHLQNAYNKYSGFKFEIVEECSQENLTKLEALYQHSAESKFGSYNIGAISDSSGTLLGARAGDAVRKALANPDVRLRMSIASTLAQSTPEARARRSLISKDVMARSDIKVKHAQAIKASYRDPALRKKVSGSIKARGAIKTAERLRDLGLLLLSQEAFSEALKKHAGMRGKYLHFTQEQAKYMRSVGMSIYKNGKKAAQNAQP